MIRLLVLFQTPPNDPATTRFVVAVACVFVLSALALGVCIGLARRVRAISERQPPSADQPPADRSDQPM